MKKMKVYEEGMIAEERHYIKIKEEPEGVKLLAVNQSGQWIWEILQIRNDGTLQLFNNIGKNVGLQLDGCGQIKIREE